MEIAKIDRRLVTIILIVFVQMLGAAMILPILPLFAQNEFNLPPQWITFLTASFFGAQFIAGPYLGRLSDRVGRVPVLIISQIGTVIAFLMIGFAPSASFLFIGRLLDGITGGNIIVAQAYIADITPPERKTISFGYVMGAFGIGFIIGPAIGGFLAAQFGPRIPYYMAAVAATIVVLLTVFSLNETVTPEQREKSRTAERDRIDFGQIFSNRTLLMLLIMAFTIQMGLGVLQSTLALYADAVLMPEAPDEQVQIGLGALFTIVGMTQLLTQLFLIGRLLPRLGEVGMITLAVGLLITGQLLMWQASSLWMAAAAAVCIAMGMGFANPSINSLATSVADESIKGEILGIVQSSTNLGVIVSSTISGFLFALSPRYPFLLAFSLALILSLPLLRLRRSVIPVLGKVESD